MKRIFNCNNKRKMTATVIAVIFLLFLYRIIFGFSAQNAEESSSVSEEVTRFIVEKGTFLYPDASASKIDLLCMIWEPIVRKLAHFSEYMLLGMCWFTLLTQWINKAALFSFLAVVISAVFDEFHQTFVPGRSGNLLDVGIDSLGGLTGIFLLICFLFSLKKIFNSACVKHNP